MNQYTQQMTLDGGAIRTRSDATVQNNLRRLIILDNGLLKESNLDSLVWRYFQNFEGVGDAMTEDQFFRLRARVDSIRREFSDVSKEFKVPNF